MFNNISWQCYWIVIALLSAGYYLLIYLLYYRSDFKIASFGKLTGSPASAAASSPSLSVSSVVQESVLQVNEDYLFDSCLNELAAFFEELKAVKSNKEELVFSLQTIFKKYSTLKNSAYEEPLRRVIVCQAEDICFIHLNAEDVKNVWSVGM